MHKGILCHKESITQVDRFDWIEMTYQQAGIPTLCVVEIIEL